MQNSGYSSYIDDSADNAFHSGAEALKDTFVQNESKAKASYASYLEKYSDKQKQIKNSVMSHLISNDVVDLNTAIAYGINAGLSREDAQSVGKSAYEITKQKVLNKIIEQTVSLGLDEKGAKMLALKMGVTEADANGIAKEVGDLLKHYRSVSDEYLDYLEKMSN